MLTASSTGESAELRCDARQKAPAFAGSGSPLYRRAMLPRECLNKHIPKLGDATANHWSLAGSII